MPETQASKPPPFPYTYPARTFEQRRHGPSGYDSYRSYKPWLRDEFAFRCVYCLDRERWSKDGAGRFGVEHLVPTSRAPSMTLKYENLYYACNRCNSAKTDNPVELPLSSVKLRDQLIINVNGTLEPRSQEAAYLVELLCLNDDRVVEYRRRVIHLHQQLVRKATSARTGPLANWFSFPDDLPDLAACRPPQSNSRPSGIAESHFELRSRGELADFY